MGSVQSSGQYAAYLQHCECAGFNVLAPYGRSVLMFQRCSRAGDSGDGLAGGGLMETRRGKRPGSDYARLLHLPSEFCYISRPREGGRESRDGRGYCEWKSKCCADSCGDMLR